jgi:porphobilinogen synthase
MAKKYTPINLDPPSLIYPYFVVSGKGRKEEIKLFPGVFRFSPDRLLAELNDLPRLGIDKILLFGIPEEKSAAGNTAYGENNVVSAAVRKIKARFPELTVMTDVCLCAYTTHGHCGVIKKSNINNAATLEALARIALSHAEAGADWVAPSAMAKRQVAAIRGALNKNGFGRTRIMGYSAKFASNFYGPFRNAARSSPKFGDRRAYQLDFTSGKQAIERIASDIEEGADMVMVKPALGYLDIIKEAKNKSSYPLAAYNVSGEYAFVKYGAKKGLWDEKKMVFEIISSIKRAGADYIITYHAKDIAKWLK